MSVDRDRCPVLFLAYGQRGYAWLRRTAERLAAHPVLSEMMDARVVQLLAVGDGTATTEDRRIAWLPPGTAAEEIQTRVRQALSERARAYFQLRLAEVLVLERWSLFGADWEPRPALREAFAAAQYVDCDPAGERLMDFRWVSLADVVRPVGKPPSALVDRIRDALTPDPMHDIRLLIDDSTAAGGVVDEAMADEAFRALAAACLTSDLAFPRTGVSDQEQSGILRSDADHGLFHPVSVLVLRHPAAEVRSSLAHYVRETLEEAGGEGGLRGSDDLAALVREEHEALEAGRYDAVMAQRRREDRAAILLANAFVGEEGRASGRARVRAAREEVRRLFPPLSPPPRPEGMAAPAVFLLQGEFPAAGWALLGAAVLAVSTAGVWLARRRALPPAEPAPASPPRGGAERASARREWELFLDGVEAALQALSQAHAARSAVPPGGPWLRSADSPHEVQLVGARVKPEPAPAVGADVYRMAAQELLNGILRGERRGATAVEAALRHAADALLARTPRPAVTGPALSFPHADGVRSVVQGTPLMALTSAGRHIPVAEVLWTVDPELNAAEALRALEHSEVRVRTRVVAGDDPDRTTRVALGEAVSPGKIISLSSLQL